MSNIKAYGRGDALLYASEGNVRRVRQTVSRWPMKKLFGGMG